MTLISPNFEILPHLWPKGQTTLRLDQISNRKDASYEVLISDRPGRSKLVIRPATQTDNPIDQIAWMADAGCKQQALRFVDQMLRQEQ